MNPGVETSDFWLFEPRDPVRRFDNTADVFYYLPSEAGQVLVEFADANGNVLSSHMSLPAADSADAEEDDASPGGGGFGGSGGGAARPSRSEGSNRFRWNMRLEGWTDFEGRIFWAAGNQGPAVVPGRYQVRLTVDGETQTQDFEIRMNPRAAAEGVTLADLQERFDLTVRIRDRVTEAHEAVLRVRSIKGQVDERLEENDNTELASLGATVNERLGEVEGEIYQVRNRSNQDPLNYPIKLNNKIAALQNLVQGPESRPTDQSL